MNCEYIKVNGLRCKGYAIRGSKYCYWHSPEVNAAEKRAVRARGGQSNRHRAYPNIALRKSNLNQIQDVVDLLGETITIVRCELEHTDSLAVRIKIANSIAYQTGFLLSAMEKATLEKKLEELEKLVLRRDHN